MDEVKLSLHPEKTRLIEFGRLAAENRRRRGDKKPKTFDFLRVYSYLFDNQVESEV
jgi:nucleoid DNA-binding protein